MEVWGTAFYNFPLPLTEQYSFLTLLFIEFFDERTTAGPLCAPRA